MTSPASPPSIRGFLRALKRGVVAVLAVGAAGATTAQAATVSTDLAVYQYVDLTNSRDKTISKFYVNDTVKYRVQVVNDGPNAADGAKLALTTEPGLVPGGWTCRVVSGSATCPAASGTGLPNLAIPKLGAKSELEIFYTVKVTGVDGQLTTTAEIQPPSGVTDSKVSNNKDSVYICTFDTSLPTQTTLLITKSSNGPWISGQSGATYTLNITNNSNFPTSGTVTVKDLLPAGVTPTSSNFTPASGWACTTSGQVVTCTSNAPINGTKSVSLTMPVNVSSAAAASITNRASVGGGGDPDPIPDPASCTTTAGQCATTTTTTSTAPQPIVCSALYALRNTGSGALNGVSIVQLDETNNTFGALVAELPTISNAQLTSATLAVSPDGKRFFVADDAERLRVYDTTTRLWGQGDPFVGVADRLVRMGVTPDGKGYAMDTSGKLWRFSTVSPFSVSLVGEVKATASGVPSFQRNGDFLAASDGKLYMISSVDGSAQVDLWLLTPETLKAEYLGNFSDPSNGRQYNGFAATPNGLFAASNYGDLVRVNPVSVSVTPVGGRNQGSTDLASCYYPVLAPNVNATKTVKKVAGSGGDAVQPGDTLEYTITVRNSGTLPAGGVAFRDALPAGTTYVPGSARVNGFTSTFTNGAVTSLTGAYPFAQPVGICSQSGSACTAQVLRIDTTPSTLDNESVVTFRVTVNSPFTNDPSQVSNQAVITYTGGETPSDDPSTSTPKDPTVTPVKQPAKLTAVKTVQNITAKGSVGTDSAGKPNDVLEYCIRTSNVGGLNATNIRFADTVPTNTTFQTASYGAGRDIRVTLPDGSFLYLTSAQDADAGALVGGRVTLSTPFGLAGGQSFTVCFRATIS